MILETWRAWINAFDRAFETGDWSHAESFLTDDVVYIVAGVPFACELRGRSAVIEGFKKSLSNFDSKFDERRWEAVDLHIWEDHAITAYAKGDYVLAGKPPLTFAAKGQWFFRDNKISVMTDIYDLTQVNVQESLQWLATHGADMDASYV
nr:nuclear transport factor 2 family protein [Hyphomonas sp. Mor2]